MGASAGDDDFMIVGVGVGGWMGGWEKNGFTVVNVWQRMGRAFMEGSMHGRRFPKDFW